MSRRKVIPNGLLLELDGVCAAEGFTLPGGRDVVARTLSATSFSIFPKNLTSI